MTGNQVKASDSAMDHFHRGVTKHHSGQYNAAITEYNTAIRFKPNFAEAYSNRGVAKGLTFLTIVQIM